MLNKSLVTEAINRQSFASKSEMDEAIRQHLGEHGADLTDTAVDILRLLSRYACKYPGVAFLKHVTIANAIGKTRLTVIRNIKRLTDRGIIEKVSFTRPVNGGKGANMYVIQPNVTGVKSNGDTSDEIHRQEAEESTLVQAKSYYGGYEPLSYTKRSSHYILDTAKAVKNAIPEVIYNTLSPFFNAADLRRLTGVIFRAKAHKHVRIRLEAHTEAFEDVIIDCVRRYKRGDITSLDGYLYASIRRLSRRLFIDA